MNLNHYPKIIPLFFLWHISRLTQTSFPAEKKRQTADAFEVIKSGPHQYSIYLLFDKISQNKEETVNFDKKQSQSNKTVTFHGRVHLKENKHLLECQAEPELYLLY